MNTILKKYIPGLSMAFFLVVFLGCLRNLILGDSMNGFAIFVVELAGYLVITAVVDTLVGCIDFKSYLANFLCETIVLYPITLLFAWMGHWFGMRVWNIVFFTVLFLVVMMAIHIYFYYMTKQEAEKINEYLETRKDEQ